MLVRDPRGRPFGPGTCVYFRGRGPCVDFLPPACILIFESCSNGTCGEAGLTMTMAADLAAAAALRRAGLGDDSEHTRYARLEAAGRHARILIDSPSRRPGTTSSHASSTAPPGAEREEESLAEESTGAQERAQKLFSSLEFGLGLFAGIAILGLVETLVGVPLFATCDCAPTSELNSRS